MDKVKITAPDEVSDKERQGYLSYVLRQLPYGTELESLKISLNNDDTVALDYQTRPHRFERIRRITGYLTGDVNRWNNSKKSELQDRVKHA